MNSQQQQLATILRQVTNFVFEPTFSTIEQVTDFVTHQEKNTAHIFGDKIVLNVDGVITIRDNILEASFFRSVVDMRTIESKLFQMMEKYKEHGLSDIIGMPVNVLFGGDVGRILLSSAREDDIKIFTLTDKSENSGYFDLVAYTHEKGIFSALTYSSTRVAGLCHSGDIGALLHWIKIKNSVVIGNSFLVGAVGYQQQHLTTFVNQNPMICLCNGNSINLIPCPLDEVTLGDATFVGLLLCNIVEEGEQKYLEYRVLNTPVTLSKIDTGDISERMQDVVQLVLTQDVIPTTVHNLDVSDVSDATTCSIMKRASDMAYNAYDSTQKYSILQFVQNSLNSSKIFNIPDSLTIPFGSGIGVPGSTTLHDQFNLPALFGQISGHSSVLLGTSYTLNIPPDQYYTLVNSTQCIVHLELSGWDDFISSNTCKKAGNAVFVIHVTDQQRENMVDLKVNCITMAGPMSLVLFENNGKYYFYRGYTGLPRLEFGAEFEFDIDNICFPNTIVDKSDNTIRIISTNEELNFSECCKYLKEPKNYTNMQSLINAFVQMTICYNSQEISEVSQIIVTTLSSMREFVLADTKREINAIVTDFTDDSDQKDKLKGLVYEMKILVNRFDDDFRHVLEFVNKEMISVKGCVSANHSLERIKRKNEIGKNVSDTLKMTTRDLVNEICQHSAESGVVVLNVECQKMMSLLTTLNNKVSTLTRRQWFSAEEFLTSEYLNLSTTCKNNRCPILDCATYDAISDVTANNAVQFNATSASCMLPLIGNEFSSTSYGCLPIPLFDELVEISDPYDVKWAELANNTYIAHFRIALRNTFLSATQCRHLKIPPDNTGFGAMMCIILMDYIEQLIESICYKIPSKDSTIGKSIRGLTCFVLTFMASGVNSQLKTWELLKKPEVGETFVRLSTPQTIKSYDTYVRLLKILPFCNWECGQAVQNLKNVSRNYIMQSTGVGTN